MKNLKAAQIFLRYRESTKDTFTFHSAELVAGLTVGREDAFELPSSFIGRVTWFEDNTMIISVAGRNYNYCGIERWMFVRFRNAGSKGRFFNKVIRGVFECA